MLDLNEVQPGRRVLITGGAGLIGRPLAEEFHRRGAEVFIVDNLVNGELPRKWAAGYLPWDVSHKGVVDIMKVFHPNLVYHLACHPYEGLSQFIPVDVTESTYISTLQVIKGCIAAGNAPRLILASSMARYGAGKVVGLEVNQTDSAHRLRLVDCGPPFSEDTHETAPEDIYGIAKVAAEQAVRVLCDMHGIQWNVAAPHNVYGTGNRMALSDPYRGFLLIWLNCLLQNKAFFIYGDGEQRRAPTYVGDIVEPLMRLGLDPEIVSQVVNIGAEQTYSINEIAGMLRAVWFEKTGRNAPEPIYEAARPCEVKYAYSSAAKSVDLLGYEDKTSLRDGLAKLVDWGLAVAPDGVTVDYERCGPYEITAKLPEVWAKRKI